jgi:8-oxo-dGDP phosphatase
MGGTEPFKKLSSKAVYENDWILVREDTVIAMNGTTGIYGIVETKAQAVSVVAISAENETCLIREYRYPVGRFLWRIPMGGAGHTQTDPLTAAKAELLEETGITARRWQKLGSIEPMSGLSTETACVYLASEIEHIGERSSAELIDRVAFVPIGAILQMIKANKMTDGQSIAAIILAATTLGWI